VQLRNAFDRSGVYDSGNRQRSADPATQGGVIVQTAHPRDVAALALVVGLFLVLFVVSLILGGPLR